MNLWIKLIVIILCIIITTAIWLRHDTIKMEYKDEEKAEIKKEMEIIVHVERKDKASLDLPLETYLEGVVGSEMGASFALEALKAQSVAARTFVCKRGFQVDDTTNTQVYHDDEEMRTIWKENYEQYHKKIQKAIQETEGEILMYQNTVITASFFSSSCGKTANADEYWQSEEPYLHSVDSIWDTKAKGYEVQVDMSEEEFAHKLGFENPVSIIEDIQYYDSGYVNCVRIDQITFSGRVMREQLGLRSSSFTIEAIQEGYRITTKGYGHGIGMSQYGAQGMALEDYNYQEILKHYYQGSEIHPIQDGL